MFIGAAVRAGPIDAFRTWGISAANHNTRMRSDSWKAKRRAKFREVGRQCQDCGTKQGRFEVHHLTYEHWGDERMDELAVLCQGCHATRHNSKRAHIKPPQVLAVRYRSRVRRASAVALMRRQGVYL